MDTQAMWQAKLAAFIHDPTTKALILMRGMGHEQGSVAELRKSVFQEESAIAALRELDPVVKRADRWASAADRPSLPRTIRGRVVFAENPALVHPLSGAYFDIPSLADGEDAAPAALEALNFEHFKEFIVKDGEQIDWRRTFLAFWRFGRVPPAPELGLLWQQLPADTRSPDHSILEHVSLTSAFAGAMCAGGDHGPALLLVSFGPVQGFIAQARSVSDLWAGSHLLSTIAWQGMRVVCERYGPDAVLFPSLAGVPLVDVWLRTEAGLDAIWDQRKDIPYPRGASDANPLFCAALPNRFLALVPADDAEALAREVTEQVRAWTWEQLEAALADIGLADVPHALEQARRQLAGFPEVNWSVVPWRLAGSGDGGLDDKSLRDALCSLGHDGAYLDPAMGKLVTKELQIEGEPFYAPNPGVAYPGLFELAERLHAAAKSVRPFDAAPEGGYRCSLCGEREWLTDDPEALNEPPGRRKDTVWLRLHEQMRIVKQGEHLCALCSLKRFWPRLFSKWVKQQADGAEGAVNRYVISTHTMALASSLWRVAAGISTDPEQEEKLKEAKSTLQKQIDAHGVSDSAALPHKLFRRLKEGEDLLLFRRLPVLLDRIAEREEEGPGREREEDREKAEKAMADLLGRKPEAYYAMLLMDGDRMGQWLAAASDKVPDLASRFHGSVRGELQARDALKDYLAARRPPSPAWHQAISTALNGFAVDLARVVVEECFMGKLIYAGGDDLLAMVAVHDLPGLMLALRCAYTGHMPLVQNSFAKTWNWLTGNTMPEQIDLRMQHGYGLLRQGASKKLLRLMGETATASMGAVVAHHKTPLSRVLGALRAAERQAKEQGGRDAFALTLMKRSGGTSVFVGNWRLDAGLAHGDMGLLLRLRDLFARPELSRRAAYILAEVVRDMPVDQDALAAVIMRQFLRQGLAKVTDQATKKALQEEAEALAQTLAGRAVGVQAATGTSPASGTGWQAAGSWLRDMFITAEFLARAGRVPVDKEVFHV